MRFIVAVLVVLMMATSGAWSAETKSDGTVVVSKGETINEDFQAAGSDITIDGRITGDASVAGSSVRVTDGIGGSLNAAAGEINVSGTIGNDAHLAGGTVILDGSVADNAALFGGTVRATKGAKVAHDLNAAGGDVTILGSVGKDLKAAGGIVRIGGPVGGSATVQADRLILLPGARITGNLDYTSSHRAEIQPGATVGGRTVYHHVKRTNWRPLHHIYRLLAFMAIFAIGVILLLLFPNVSAGIAGVARTGFGWSLLWGFIIAAAVPVAAFIAMFTLIGIPLALIVLALYAILMYIGQIFVAYALGNAILKNTQQTGGWRVLAFFIGLAILTAVEMIPFLGWIVSLIVVLAGFGAVLLYFFRLYPPRRANVEVASSQ